LVCREGEILGDSIDGADSRRQDPILKIVVERTLSFGLIRDGQIENWECGDGQRLTRRVK
jgi:hypothetical protein